MVTLPVILIESRYRDSMINNTLQDNHLTIHHNVCVSKEYKIPLKGQSQEFLYSFTTLWRFTESGINRNET